MRRDLGIARCAAFLLGRSAGRRRLGRGSITATHLGEYVRHHSCDRRFHLAIHEEREAGALPFLDRLRTDLDPVLAEVGRRREDQWEAELAQMRDRIKTMRKQLVDKIRSQRADYDFSYVIDQRGMFSYSGLTKDQVTRLREEFSIYAIDTGRICVAALNSRNIGTVAGALIGQTVNLKAYGLDAAFPAAFIAMIWPLLRQRRSRRAAVIGATVCLVLIPFAPIGVPILCASLGVLAGVPAGPDTALEPAIS